VKRARADAWRTKLGGLRRTFEETASPTKQARARKGALPAGTRSLRICFVASGKLPIPPVGWGAVQSLLWDYLHVLPRLGHEVAIVNTRSPESIVREVERIRPDVVHVQSDSWIQLADELEAPVVAITSHDPYLAQPARRNGSRFAQLCAVRNAFHVVLSDAIRAELIRGGVPAGRIWVVPNGVRPELFAFRETCEERSVCLGVVGPRKRQSLLRDVDGVDFVGRVSRAAGPTDSRYLGEWKKKQLHRELTRFANLVLLSDGEAHALVCPEGLSAGLGLVLSEACTANLDPDLPFVDVVPESHVSDRGYLADVLAQNRRVAMSMRRDIRRFAEERFSLQRIAATEYLPALEQMLDRSAG
jgi:glycosyltransferase involved in cell wall biosynthesis